MNFDNKKIFLFLLILFSLLPFRFSEGNVFFGINSVSALEVKYPPIFGLRITEISSFPEYAKYFFNLGIALAGTLAVLVIIFGGVYYLISFGRGKFTNEGKEWIKAGIIGLLILVSAYLIVYTINPDLIYFRLEKLIPILSNILPGAGPAGPSVPVVVYNEIPIGTLTENLISRTTDCYDFDYNGDPIAGDQVKTDDNKTVAGPTYRDHDRVDCILKLGQAAEKKAKIASDLSNEIIKLMQTCSCAGKCDPMCDKNSGCAVSGKKCVGSCVKGACAPSGSEGNCCPQDVKNKIEHGPIKIGADIKKEYKGLDEFRTQISNISSLIEKQVQVEGKQIIIIALDKWHGLKLIEQLMYFKEKTEKIKSAVETDLKQLNDARAVLANCYTAKSSVDLLEIIEATKKEEKVIMIQKTFTDPATNTLVDSSKYCKGFSYANSDCYNTCQNMCPEYSQQAIDCYKGCPECKDNDLNCLKGQKKCMQQCFDSRECVAGNFSGTMQNCINNCRNQCSDICSQKFLQNSDEFKKCKERCDNNSKCLLENEDKCLVNFQDLKQCASQDGDFSNLKNCIDGSHLCEYCSSQYSGYPDCVTNPKRQDYSSSSLYLHPGYQVCENPYDNYYGMEAWCIDVYPETAKCSSASECPDCPCAIVKETISQTISQSSNSSNYNYNPPQSLPGEPGYVPGGGSSGGGSQGGTKTIQTTFSNYRTCSGQCGEYGYNGDPLTFYCKSPEGILSDEEKSGELKYESAIRYTCSKTYEIPVGQGVDNAREWADELFKNISDFTKKVQNMVKYLKQIGEEKNYCQCDSKYDGDAPICKTDCQYNEETTTTTIDPYTGEEITTTVPPSCTFVPCSGNPCQKMINLLSAVSGYYDKIKEGLASLNLFILIGKRTDIVKELIYSRNTMNDCSVYAKQQNPVYIYSSVVTEFRSFVEGPIKTISCYRAYMNGFVQERCYGWFEGFVSTPPEDLTDNWFCCEKVNR